MLELELPAGSLGVGIIQRDEDGMCLVSSKSNPHSPLAVGDVIVSLNTLELKKVDGGVQKWVELFKAMQAESIPRKVVVLRAAAANGAPAPWEVQEASAPPNMDGASAPSTDGANAGTSGASAPKTAGGAGTETSNSGASASGDAPKDDADADAASDKPPSKEAKEDGALESTDGGLKVGTVVRINGADYTMTAEDVEAFKASAAIAEQIQRNRQNPNWKPAEIPKDLSRPKNAEDVAESREAGYISPLDITEEKLGRKVYPNTFREFVRLSDRMKGILESMNDPVPEGYCTKILDADFDQLLAPFTEDMKVPFSHDSDINRFAMFMWNMFDACETGSIGGDACRMNGVLVATTNDVLAMWPPRRQMEHLLASTIAIVRHGLRPFLQRGSPESGKAVFGELAKMWKKFFEQDRAHHYEVSDGLREFARDSCEQLQKMLKSAREDHGECAMQLNFNYIRIPRPKRKKEAQLAKAKENSEPSSSNLATAGGEGSAKKKRRTKVSPAEALMERINAVEGVPSDAAVYDSCETVREKLRAFLQREGVTKKNLCAALGGLNNNSLNRFLDAKEQKQSGNRTYRNAYIFFEKQRVLDCLPKTAERLTSEQQRPGGYDIEKPKGGRPPSVYRCPEVQEMMERAGWS